MAFDTYNYDIKSKLPLWWQEDTFLEPINRYSQDLLKELIGGFLSNLGVVQPVQVWKTLPTEYSWTHTYIENDDLLRTKQGGTSSKHLIANTPIIAQIPNSKRNCHGIIQLQLNGDNLGTKKNIGKLTIKNANQTITIKNINTMTDIKIFTEDQSILIDGVQRSDLVEGSFNKIYSQAKNDDYSNLDIDDENKITFIEIESDTNVYFDLKIKHIHPIYVTEQNIRVYTVSAFPLESIKLYGFYCNDFNYKQEWRYLWEKTYDIEDRIVFDRITKQFDCEIFYIQVKFHGIGFPLTYGFPQEEYHTNTAFNTNKVLDKWGKIFGLPRRYYKSHISDNEEPFTFPPFYKYDIEQDYWYEQRLVNEYRYNEDAINASYIKDSELNNIALLQSIDPFIEDVYVYTETISPSLDNSRNIGYINPTYIIEGGEGVSWTNSSQLENTTLVGAEITLNPKTDKFLNNEKTYQTKILELYFDDIPEMPSNIKITGLELKLHGITDIHSDSLALDNRSYLLLPNYSTNIHNEVIENVELIPLVMEDQSWKKGKNIYSIGGENMLFGLNSLSKEQIENGIRFELGFTNNSDFLTATMTLYNIQLFIYYEIIMDDYDIDVIFDSKTIVINDPDKQEINITIPLKNTGIVPITNKNIYIAVPPELSISNQTFPPINLDVGEPFVVGENHTDTIDDHITITCPNNITGLYDVIVFCDEKVIKNEIVVKEVDINDIE